MNASSLSPGASTSDSVPVAVRRRPWIILLWLACVFVVAGLIAVPVLAIHSFRAGEEVAAVCSSVFENRASDLHGRWRKQVSLRVGRTPLWLARVCVPGDQLPPEALVALESVRGVDVGIYHWVGERAGIDRESMIASATATMLERGWSRIVSVLDGKDAVAVFMPADVGDSENGELRACVFVCDGSEGIVVHGTIATAGLEKLAGTAIAQSLR